MKASIVLPTLLPLLASAGVLQTRQGLAGQLPGGKVPQAMIDAFMNMKTLSVAGVDKLTPQIRPGAQRTLTKFGPIELKGAMASKDGSAGGHSHGAAPMGGMGDSTVLGQTNFFKLPEGFCNKDGPCTVLGGRVGLMFENGTVPGPAAGIYIHHLLTFNQQKKQAKFLGTCDKGYEVDQMPAGLASVGSGFLGTGEDTGKSQALYTTKDGKHDAGNWINKGDTFVANAQLVNYNKETQKLYLTYETEFVPGNVGGDTRSVLLSVTQCGTPVALDKNGPAVSKSGKFTFLEDGYIVGSRGHIHDGGDRVVGSINGKPYCDSVAGYGGPGSETMFNGKKYLAISSMVQCGDLVEVKKGDVLSFDVTYDLKSHPLRPSVDGHETDVMAMFNVNFAGKK